MNKNKDFNEIGLGLTDLRKSRYNKELDNNNEILENNWPKDYSICSTIYFFHYY